MRKKIDKKFRAALDDLLWIFYPTICAACERPLISGEECLCTFCRFSLPRTNFHLESINPVIKHFWGKVPVEAATSYYYFSKGESVQRMIHKLKYKDRKDVGVFVGEMMGADLRSSRFSGADLIVPVPLHEKKLKIRGYNQSDCIAEGMASKLGAVFEPAIIYRKAETETQTRKHRFERYSNVENVFEVNRDLLPADKHILLVDDVITTGSTLISCTEALLKVPGTKVSIASIACA